MLFFLFSFVLDFTDGIVARHQKRTSFYGRFIDGLFDIFVLGFLHIVFLIYLINNNNINIFYLIFYLLTILIVPIQHLILDRYSALARWCNEINKKKTIKPYYRNNYFNIITMLLLDFQHFIIFYILLKNDSNFNYIINSFFVISFFASLFSILIYFKLAKKNFSLISNQKDNNE